MKTYLQRLQEQFDELTDGITTLVQRASDEDRDLNGEEDAQIAERDKRREELQKSIDVQSGLLKRANDVREVVGKVTTAGPRVERTKVEEDEYDIAREFPTPGHYAQTFHRATMLKERDAIEALERATAHQKLADNPGLIPRPILGPVINMIEGGRPFIASIGTRPLPAGSFDRPKITQHVEVGKQAAEKDQTASQKMVIGKLPVVATTYAGHLNISRQDVKWSSPSILTIVFEDFATIYAIRTCEDAVAQFVASVTEEAPIATGDQLGVTTALYEAAAAALSRSDQLPDTLWTSPDVWARLGGMLNAMGGAAFPSLSLTGTGGNPIGLRLVVDQHFPAGTLIMGTSRFAEWYEDIDGLMQIQEPDILGQLVGFAGFGAFLNTAPEAFTRFALPTPGGGSAAAAKKTASSSSN